MSENKRPVISLIIPFYNVERYIGQCLESVYSQDIPEEDYEVICINDASPDNSREIVLEYKKKHKNLVLVEHEINKKLGSARNTGRSLAQGKYIWNIDSDDTIKVNCLMEIVSLCESQRLDILCFNFEVVNGLPNNPDDTPPFINSTVVTGIDFFNIYFSTNIGKVSQVWTQIYNREFLNKNGIYSPEMNMAEDGPYAWKSILCSKRIMSICDSFYIYRVVDSSLSMKMRKSPSPMMIYEKCFLFSDLVLGLIDLIPQKNDLLINNFYNTIRYAISSYPQNLLNLTKKEICDFYLLCNQDKNIIKRQYKFMSRRNVFLMKLFFLSPNITRFVLPYIIK